jgi:hypothetical protein
VLGDLIEYKARLVEAWHRLRPVDDLEGQERIDMLEALGYL